MLVHQRLAKHRDRLRRPFFDLAFNQIREKRTTQAKMVLSIISWRKNGVDGLAHCFRIIRCVMQTPTLFSSER